MFLFSTVHILGLPGILPVTDTETLRKIKFQSSVCLLQTTPSGANIGVWCVVRMKKMHINVGNNKLKKK